MVAALSLTLHAPAARCHADILAALQVGVGDRIRLGRVLAVKQGGKFTVGKPYLEDIAVEAEVLEELRGPKVQPVSCEYAETHYYPLPTPTPPQPTTPATCPSFFVLLLQHGLTHPTTI